MERAVEWFEQVHASGILSRGNCSPISFRIRVYGNTGEVGGASGNVPAAILP